MGLTRQGWRYVRPGPRGRLAARLYATGAVRTKKDASRALGLTPTYLSNYRENLVVNGIMEATERALADETVGLSRVVQLLSRQALARLGELMDSRNEHIALKASSDVLDRNAETSKTLKASVTTWSLDGTDAKELAKALVEAARVKERYAELASGDVVRVTDPQQGDGNGSSAGNAGAGVQGDNGKSRETVQATESAEGAQGSPQT